jgi:creatinine amidohydrolase/Fe(II)-dependent formamide hydrolase-like protein
MPFNAYGGSAGLRRKTVSNFVTECCKTWFLQGFKRIMILTLCMDGSPGVRMAVSRLNKRQRSVKAADFCSLQNEDAFREFCDKRYGGTELGRSEWGLRALMSYLRPGLFRRNMDDRIPIVPSREEYGKWYRRGMDPYKLRKMSPNANLSDFVDTFDAAAGKKLFDIAVELLTDKITRFTNEEDYASR